MHTQIPNLLTLLRLIAAPMVGLIYVLLPSPLADWIALCLFVGAAMTDYLDGVLARRWNVVTAFGRMLDPIADKAMVVIALAVLAVRFNGYIPVMVPMILILFREVFVSGLREFLGADAARLQVTRLAKFKTAVQMLAIILLFVALLASHYLVMLTWGMDGALVDEIMAGRVDDEFGLRLLEPLVNFTWWGGIATLWIAALLTVLSGVDYFVKALPYLKEPEA
ncbi:MAG: CDP-diacylglycerol--glycerol-3-phosphate 3-phosphatidyltransferase [Paracoccaceae bacterium]